MAGCAAISFLALVICLLSARPLPAAPRNVFTRRFVRSPGNLTIQSNYDNVVERLQNAAAAGYNGLFLDNIKVWTISLEDQAFITRLQALKAEAVKSNMALMPYSMGSGEPSIMSLKHACAFPVAGTNFSVSGGMASLVPDPGSTLTNGGFETHTNGMPSGWKMSGVIPAKNIFIDNSVKQEGAVSARFEGGQNVDITLSQSVKVLPHRAYKFSMMVKTQGLTTAENMGVLITVGGKPVVKMAANDPIRLNQNWSEFRIDFNSFDKSTASLSIQVLRKANTAGQIWLDAVKVQETGLYELHRGRTSLAVIVKSADGSETYSEGSDYTIDYKLARHQQSRMLIPAGSSVLEGASLKVDWFQLADNFRNTWLDASFCHDAVWADHRRNVTKLHEVIGPVPGWLFRVNQWQIGYWDPGCHQMYASPGEYQGSTIKKCADLVRESNPQTETYVWGHAFDPYFYGKGTYALINGQLDRGWEYLHPETIILNTNASKTERSVRFFAGMDPAYPHFFRHQLLDIMIGIGPAKWLELLDKLEAEGLPKDAVAGVQFTVWFGNDYSRLKPLADQCRAAGRWGTNTNPFVTLEKPGIAAGDGRSIGEGKVLLSGIGHGRMVYLRFGFLGPGCAAFEAYDIRGRRVFRKELGQYSAGMHRSRLVLPYRAGVLLGRLRVTAKGNVKSGFCRIPVLP